MFIASDSTPLRRDEAVCRDSAVKHTQNSMYHELASSDPSHEIYYHSASFILKYLRENNTFFKRHSDSILSRRIKFLEIALADLFLFTECSNFWAMGKTKVTWNHFGNYAAMCLGDFEQLWSFGTMTNCWTMAQQLKVAQSLGNYTEMCFRRFWATLIFWLFDFWAMSQNWSCWKSLGNHAEMFLVIFSNFEFWRIAPKLGNWPMKLLCVKNIKVNLNLLKHIFFF